MIFFVRDLGYLTGGFALNGVSYAADWITTATEAEREAIHAYRTPTYNVDTQVREDDPVVGWVVREMTAGELQVVTDRETAGRRACAIAAVQARLDTYAQSWGYDNIFTACTYADEPTVLQFQAEGQALRAWRSATWAVCYANVDAPSLDALLALLPAHPVRPS